MLRILEGALRASKREFHELLTQLPSHLDDLYEKILGSCPDIKQAKKILRIVVAATRPLTLDEMNISLVIQPHHRSVRDLAENLLPPAGTESSLKETCGLFIRVIDSKVYLVHQTAKEFLLKGQGTVCDNPGQGAWKHTLDPIESNCILASICLCYLLLSNFEANPLHAAASGDFEREVGRYTG